jgi:hypothetical protein
MVWGCFDLKDMGKDFHRQDSAMNVNTSDVRLMCVLKIAKQRKSLSVYRRAGAEIRQSAPSSKL